MDSMCPIDAEVFNVGMNCEPTFSPKLSNIQACKTKVTLQEAQVIQILRFKLSNDRPGIKKVSPSVLAKEYGISEKAVRDIWKGRTWLRETMHLDPSLAALASRLRPPGRPRVQTDGASRRHRLGSNGEIGSRPKDERTKTRQRSPCQHLPSCSMLNEEECSAKEKAKTRKRLCPDSEKPRDAIAGLRQGSCGVSPLEECSTRNKLTQVNCNAFAGLQPAPAGACGVLSLAAEHSEEMQYTTRGRRGVTRSPLSAPAVAHPGPAFSLAAALWRRALVWAEAAEPLPPPSSRAEDPFHDDWAHWQEPPSPLHLQVFV
jgi:hypothetical protein